MNNLIINIITAVITLVTLGIALHTYLNVAKEKKAPRQSTISKENEKEYYDEIVRITRSLEIEREKNTGEHFEDETVYLNRAKLIRETSPFFSWVK